MGYESMIEKALAEGELRLCLLGFGEYAIPSRDERFDRLTDYDTLLLNFSWYQQAHPQAGLKEAYGQTLAKMLAGGRPADIYCAALCLITHVGLVQKPGFHFDLADDVPMLQGAVSSMEEHREAIVAWIDALYRGQVVAERYYSAVLMEAADCVHRKGFAGGR